VNRKEFVKKIFERAWGPGAMEKDFTYEEVIAKLGWWNERDPSFILNKVLDDELRNRSKGIKKMSNYKFERMCVGVGLGGEIEKIEEKLKAGKKLNGRVQYG